MLCTFYLFYCIFVFVLGDIPFRVSVAIIFRFYVAMCLYEFRDNKFILNRTGALLENTSSEFGINHSFTKPFGTHTFYQGMVEPTPHPPSSISETIALMSVKFCRALETPSKVLEMLKLFT